MAAGRRAARVPEAAWIYQFPLLVRVSHWLNALCLAIHKMAKFMGVVGSSAFHPLGRSARGTDHPCRRIADSESRRPPWA